MSTGAFTIYFSPVLSTVQICSFLVCSNVAFSGSRDAITIDMGASYNGYCADMTRTVFVDSVNDNIKDIYDLVLDNQLIALRRNERWCCY